MTDSATLATWLVTEPSPLPVEAAGQPSAAPSADAEARALTAAVARGDEAAFRQLYDRYHQRLFRFVLVLSRGDDSLANDTLQAVWVTTASKLRQVESEAHLWNWLARVARQHLLKCWRRQQRDAAVLSPAELTESAPAGQPDTLLEECLDAALLALEPEERVLVERFYFDGLSHKDIARQLNLTPKAVSSRLERARARLRVGIARQLSRET